MILGGNSSPENGDRRRDCQTWQRGDNTWTDMGAGARMHSTHTKGGYTALGRVEMMVVGGREAEGNVPDTGVRYKVVEILERGETWVRKRDFPQEMDELLLVAKSSQIVYSFGGSEADAVYTDRVLR